MKKLILIGGLFWGLFSQAQMVIEAESSQLDMQSVYRPSCEKLAWRWIMALSRQTESEIAKSRMLVDKANLRELAQITSRLPEGSAEGGDGLVTQTLVFLSPEIHPNSFQLEKIEGAAVSWENVTSNLTDRVRFHVQEGMITVEAELPYEQYCFHKGASKIQGSLNGQPVELTWRTKSIDLKKYFDLLK